MSAEGRTLATPPAERASTIVESTSLFEASRSADQPHVEHVLLELAQRLGRRPPAAVLPWVAPTGACGRPSFGLSSWSP